jgi:hypothetical protein
LELIEEVAAFLIEPVSFQVVRDPAPRNLAGAQLLGDGLRDLALYREDVAQRPIVCARPQVIAVGDPIELRRDSKLITRFAYASFENGVHVQLLANLPDVDVPAFERKGGGSRHHVQVGHPAQRVDDFFGQAIAEVFLVFLRAQIEERKHHNGVRLPIHGCRGSEVPALP